MTGDIIFYNLFLIDDKKRRISDCYLNWAGYRVYSIYGHFLSAVVNMKSDKIPPSQSQTKAGEFFLCPGPLSLSIIFNLKFYADKIVKDKKIIYDILINFSNFFLVFFTIYQKRFAIFSHGSKLISFFKFSLQENFKAIMEIEFRSTHLTKKNTVLCYL